MRDVALADVAEGARILQLDLVRRPAPAARSPPPPARRSRACGPTACARPRGSAPRTSPTVDAPALGGGLLQHLPHRGAALAHRLDEVAHAARAVGVLVAVFLLVARRLHDAHARPVGLHLVGDDHRQAGAHAGAHLGAVRDDGHDAVGSIDDEDVRVVDRAARHLAGAGGIGGQRRRRGRIWRRAPARRSRPCPSARTRRLTFAIGDR